MKKLLPSLLIILLLCSCSKQAVPTDIEVVVPPNPEQTAPAYKSVVCKAYKSSDWQQVRFSNGSVSLQLELPRDWTLEKDGDGYTIMCEDMSIGTVTKTPPAPPESYFEAGTEYVKERLVMTSYQINRYEGERFCRVYEFNTDCGSIYNVHIYITVDYGELDDSSGDRLYNSAFCVKKTERVDFPDPSTSNGSKRILMLGNSFINSSRVNMILEDMLRDTDYSLTAVARPNVQAHDYADDLYICEQIKSGEYSYVFLCGFYNDENVDAAKKFSDLCAQSGTHLIMFPAHNEAQSVIDSAHYGLNITLLDWRGELEGLIDSGVSVEDLREDGIYRHSNLVSGYVGAHMIYRHMFAKIPPTLKNSPITQAQVDAVLHGYSQKMHTPQTEEPDEYYGSEYKI